MRGKFGFVHARPHRSGGDRRPGVTEQLGTVGKGYLSADILVISPLKVHTARCGTGSGVGVAVRALRARVAPARARPRAEGLPEVQVALLEHAAENAARDGGSPVEFSVWLNWTRTCPRRDSNPESEPYERPVSCPNCGGVMRSGGLPPSGPQVLELLGVSLLERDPGRFVRRERGGFRKSLFDLNGPRCSAVIELRPIGELRSDVFPVPDANDLALAARTGERAEHRVARVLHRERRSPAGVLVDDLVGGPRPRSLVQEINCLPEHALARYDILDEAPPALGAVRAVGGRGRFLQHRQRLDCLVDQLHGRLMFRERGDMTGSAGVQGFQYVGQIAHWQMSLQPTTPHSKRLSCLGGARRNYRLGRHRAKPVIRVLVQTGQLSCSVRLWCKAASAEGICAPADGYFDFVGRIEGKSSIFMPVWFAAFGDECVEAISRLGVVRRIA